MQRQKGFFFFLSKLCFNPTQQVFSLEVFISDRNYKRTEMMPKMVLSERWKSRWLYPKDDIDGSSRRGAPRSFVSLHPLWSEDGWQQGGGEYGLTEKKKRGEIDASTCCLLFMFAASVKCEDKWTSERQSRRGALISTPWPPGSPGRRRCPRWPPSPPCSSCSFCVCASGGCRPPRCHASYGCCC